MLGPQDHELRKNQESDAQPSHPGAPKSIFEVHLFYTAKMGALLFFPPDIRCLLNKGFVPLIVKANIDLALFVYHCVILFLSISSIVNLSFVYSFESIKYFLLVCHLPIVFRSYSSNYKYVSLNYQSTIVNIVLVHLKYKNIVTVWFHLPSSFFVLMFSYILSLNIL